MNNAINHRGGLDTRAPTSEAGQYVVLRAEVDFIICMSSCPEDIDPVNGGFPADCEVQILGEPSISPSPSPYTSLVPSRRRVKVALSIDFDAVSQWLGTCGHPDNNMADYSSGVFAGQVGVYRLLDLFKKYDIANKVIWFIPGHTTETFPASAKAVLESGAEIGLHGYSHEGIHQITETQERDVLDKSIEVATELCGKKPRGYRAPMYSIREATIRMLRQHGFPYDSSLMHHDSQPYFTPSDPPIQSIDFQKPASSWMHPTPIASHTNPGGQHPLVETPCGWYNEDGMPLQYLPHLANSMGYISAYVIEQMWKDKFMWLWENSREEVSGMAHIIGMVERIIKWLQGFGDQVQFHTHEDISRAWLAAEESETVLN